MFMGVSIQVVNRSSVSVEIVDVKIGGESFEARNIQPGGHYVWRFRPSSDGSFQVHGLFVNGRSIQGRSLGYTTVNDRFDHRLIIHEDGIVTYEAIG